MDRRTQFMFARKATTRKLIKGFINKMLLLCERVVYILRGFESEHTCVFVRFATHPHTLMAKRQPSVPKTNDEFINNN